MSLNARGFWQRKLAVLQDEYASKSSLYMQDEQAAYLAELLSVDESSIADTCREDEVRSVSLKR